MSKRKVTHDDSGSASQLAASNTSYSQSQNDSNQENQPPPNAMLEKRQKKERVDTRISCINQFNDENTLSQLEATQNMGRLKKDKNARAGIIERVYLKNFKCHSLLEFNLHDRINFILGRNGSGKSAVMDAVILILGARATCTGRQASAKTFIKTNADKAEISVTLRNEGDEAYKPSEYGPKITIERKLNKDGTSHYRILDSNRKLVSNKKQELDNIVEQFNIQVENPVCFLNQETSKHFLNSSNKSDKYKLFLKASQLESMRILQEQIEHERQVSVNMIEEKASHMQRLQDELYTWEEKYKKCQSMDKLRKKSTALYQEYSWAVVIRMEKDIDKVRTEKQAVLKSREKHEAKIADEQEKLAKASEEYERSKKEISESRKNTAENHARQEKAEKEFKTATQNYKTVQSEIKRIQAQIERKTKDKNELVETCKREKATSRTGHEEEKQKKESTIRQLSQEIKELSEKESALSRELATFTSNMEKAQRSLGDKKANKLGLEKAISGRESEIQTLRHSIRNQIAKFGDFMPGVCDEVLKTHQAGRFKEKPRGPIGMFIEPKDMRWSLAIEQCISGLMTSFVCGSYEDERILSGIFAKHIKLKQQRPRIIVTEFRNSVHDTSRYRPDTSDYSTVYDMLNIKDPVVANTLIDQRKIETVLLLPDRNVGQEVIERGRVANCQEAFLMNGDQLLNSQSFRYYSCRFKSTRYFIESPQARINSLNQEIADLRVELTQLAGVISELAKEATDSEASRRQLEKQNDALRREIMSKRNKLKQAESIKIPEPPDIAYFEQQVKEAEEEIDGLAAKKQEIEANTGDLKATFEQAAAHREALLRELGDQSDQVEKLREAFKKAENDESKHKEAIEHYKRLLKDLVAKEAEKDKLIALKESELTKLTEVTKGERIETRKTPEAIDQEIKHIVKQIESSQQLHGSEEEITRKYSDMRAKYKRIASDITKQKLFLAKLKKGLAIREAAIHNFIIAKSLRCSVYFGQFLSARDFSGGLVFNHEDQTLDIHIKTNKSRDQNEMHDLRGLSGGERSFSTVAFLLSLWSIVESPLLFLDEFDVFMDQVNRKFALDLLVNAAKEKISGQFVFLTPQDLDVEPDENVKLFKMPDPKRSIDQ